MSSFTTIARSAMQRIAEGHRQRSTRRTLEGLSAHIQKDIGWPTEGAAERPMMRRWPL